MNAGGDKLAIPSDSNTIWDFDEILYSETVSKYWVVVYRHNQDRQRKVSDLSVPVLTALGGHERLFMYIS